MKLASFDIEIATPIPENCKDWRTLGPLGISCAAIAFNDTSNIEIWQNPARLTQQEAKNLVYYMKDLEKNGYTIITWNGCKFDFAVLAIESNLLEECARIAINHVDLMMLVTFQKGYYLKLDKALQGARLQGKLKKVTLSDGSIITNMDGALAPTLWSQGEYDAVLAYLKQDVVMTLKLAEFVQRTKTIQWISNNGTRQSVYVNRLFTVKECFQFPEPDTSWMTTPPPSRDDFIRWMPSGVA